MDMNNLYIALAIIAAVGAYMLFSTWRVLKTDAAKVDTVYEDLVNENETLQKKAVALEQKVNDDKLVINDLLTQQRSYDTMDRYIKHLETTVQNLTKTTDDVKQEEPKDE